MYRKLIYLCSFFLLCGVQTSGAAGPADHLVLYLPFDEGSGAVTADASATGLQATLEGSYEWTAGKFGQAVGFTAGQAVLSESDPLNLPYITVMAWVNPTSIVNVDTVNTIQRLRSKLTDRCAQTRARRRRVIFGDFTNGIFRVNAETDLNAGGLTFGQETIFLGGAVENHMI